jgi:hypothetical protein
MQLFGHVAILGELNYNAMQSTGTCRYRKDRHMARRKDGTGRRYEFQLFDDSGGQGRAIYQAIAEAQDRGISAAAFIRMALLFYIEHEHQQRHELEPSDALAHVRRELADLKDLLSGGPVPTTATPAKSTGLDMNRPRKSIGRPAVAHPAIPEPTLSPEDSARLLVASIRGYGRSQMQNGAGD